jgi:hypothetical protein
VSKLEPAKIIQALALFDEKSSNEYGLALWAALHEVEKFYQPAHAQIDYRRYYIVPSPPNSSLFGNISRAIGQAMPGGQAQTAPDMAKHGQILSFSGLSALLSQSTSRTYDQAQLAAAVRKLIEPQDPHDHLMIITGRPITPPAKWRYIMWDTDFNANTSVISVSPLDPEFWLDKDPNRVTRIKTRARNIALLITGLLTGLERCDNPACFLFEGVVSVTALDGMHALGTEHNVPELTAYGFDDTAGDPTLVQTPTVRPISKRVL